MIANKLTLEELHKIFNPILRLENIEVVKKAIYDVMHISKYSVTDKQQYRINSFNDGVYTTYDSYEIEIKRLSDPKNSYTGVIVQFKRKKKFFDFLGNPNKKLFNELQKLCDKEISEAWLTKFDPGGIEPENVKEKFWYQLGSLNDEWRTDSKVSPLFIFTREKATEYFIEFLFNPECYERKSDKTLLRDNWLDIFHNYTGPWDWRVWLKKTEKQSL